MKDSENNQPGPYNDIINLPHHVSKNHRQMPIWERAAQFAPFAALTGHDAAINEAGRITQSMIELDEDERAELDRRLYFLLSEDGRSHTTSVTYFVPDRRKKGGAYRTVTGRIVKVVDSERVLVMDDGTRIGLEAVVHIE